MVYSRQKLYDVNHVKYIKSILSNSFHKIEAGDFDKSFTNLTGMKGAIPLSRGRVGLYLAIKNMVSKKRNRVLMSPFTIFDVVNMVIVGGGIPVFCDSESPYSPHISLDTIKKNVDESVSTVIITHYHTVNPHIEEIASWCKKNNISLIEDCAISLGSFINGKHVGSFGDASFFSFGLFKFVATYFGGAVWFKDDKLKENVTKEIFSWSKMGKNDLKPYFLKGVKLSSLTNKYIFNWFTFPIFKFGFVYNIDFIKNQAKNDPAPHLKNEFPESYKKRVSNFQISEFIRQFNNILKDKSIRNHNAQLHYNNLISNEEIVTPPKPKECDSFLNFPIVLKSINRDIVIKEIMKKNYDVSIYYYRNCAKLDCFSNYYKELPNIEFYVNNIIILPLYPSLPKEYIENMDREVNKIINNLKIGSKNA